MTEAKHGCYLCGTKEHPVLTSRTNPFQGGVGAALCPPCEKRYDKEGPGILAPGQLKR